MCEKRTGKTIVVTTNNDMIKTEYGTLNKTNTEVIFIKTKMKVKPMEDRDSYTEELINLENKFRSSVSYINRTYDEFSDKMIVIFTISEKYMSTKKPCLLRYEIYIRPLTKKNIKEYDDIMPEYIFEVNNMLKKHLTDNGFIIL